jgi:predicted secreted protein
MALAARNLVVRVRTSDNGAFHVVDDLKEASMSQSGNNQDVSTFGSAWIRRIQGLKDATYSLSGFYNPSDADGQAALRAAWLGDAPITVQFLPDGTTGFQQSVRVSTYEVSASVDGVQEVSIELEGDGAISAVPAV